ncbi:MAG: hypothetical protein ABDI20_09175, partial [Candidatus Bipolaricaulaceae bacterium]
GGPKEAYEVVAGGRRPRNWSDLRSFGHLGVIYPEELTRPEPMAHASVAPLTTLSLTIFCWELANYPEENLLLRFKTDFELTVEVHNRLIKEGVPVTLAVQENLESSPNLVLAGFPQLLPTQVEELFKKARDESPSRAIKVPVQGVVGLVEHRLGITLQELTDLLLRLASADKEGKFDAVYSELLTQGLDGLVKWFQDRAPPWHVSEARIRAYVRALALHWERLLAQDPQLQPQARFELKQLSPGPWKIAFGLLMSWAASKLLDALFDAIVSFIEGKDKPSFVRGFVSPVDDKHIELEWEGMDPVQIEFFRLCKEWVLPRIEKFGSPRLPGSIAPIDDDWELLFTDIGTWFMFPESYRYSVGVICGFITTYIAKYHEVCFQYGDKKMREKFTPDFQYMLETIAYLKFAVAGKWELCGAVPVEHASEVRVVLRRIRKGDPQPYDGKVLIRTDIAVVNYTNKVPERDRTLGWIGQTVKALERNAHKGRLGPSGTVRWGLDAAAVVITSELDQAGAEKLLEIAKTFKESANFTGMVRKDPEKNDKLGRAVVMAWRIREDMICYIWIDLGPGESSFELRKETVRSLIGGTVDDQYIEVHPDTPRFQSSDTGFMVAVKYEDPGLQNTFPIWYRQ